MLAVSSLNLGNTHSHLAKLSQREGYRAFQDAAIAKAYARVVDALSLACALLHGCIRVNSAGRTSTESSSPIWCAPASCLRLTAEG